ncbi:MAG TPA: FecR domain-containing protein [Puia sp.]
MGQEHKEYTWNLIAKRLNGEATPEELRELEDLLRCNPELHYPMQTISDLWNDTSLPDRQMAERAFNRHIDRMQELNIDFSPRPSVGEYVESTTYPFAPAQPRSRRKTPLLISSFGVMLALAFGWFYYRPSTPLVAPAIAMAPTQSGNEIFTGNGSRTHLVLPDGSVVWLNAGSRISYGKNYGTAAREVNLTGEAFFDVAPNSSKPFVIHTTRIDIRVLGTSFNVKSYPTERTTETTLIRGSIEVSIKNRPSDKIILKPNQKLVVADDSTLRQPSPRRREIPTAESLVTISKPTYEHNSGAIIETSWINNKLIFQDEEFSELAKQMERWYGVSIRFDNLRQEDWRFTGTFDKETIQQALDALKLTANFNYTIEGAQIIIHDK